MDGDSHRGVDGHAQGADIVVFHSKQWNKTMTMIKKGLEEWGEQEVNGVHANAMNGMNGVYKSLRRVNFKSIGK